MHSTKYILIFVTSMTVLVALLLSLMYTGLKPIHQTNEALYTKRAILYAVQGSLDKSLEEMTDEEVAQIFSDNITQVVLNKEGKELDTDAVKKAGYPGGTAEYIDMAQESKKPENERIYPLFIYDNGSSKEYITSVRGNGLWDAIWGNIALATDFSTIKGVSFDHKGETPGLGAEIKDNAAFKEQFIGKTILDKDGEFVGINVVKGGAKDGDSHAVDGITGATITADGVEEMIKDDLKEYMPYFTKMKMN